NDAQIPIDPETQLQDWDCPAAFDMQKLTNDICETRSLLESQTHPSDANSPSTHASQWANPPENIDSIMGPDSLKSLQQLVRTKFGLSNPETTPFSIILLDGILLFHKTALSQGGCHPGSICDTGVFIYAHYSTLKNRRNGRSGYATKDGIWVDPPGYFDNIVWPNFIKFHPQFVDHNGEIISAGSQSAYDLDNDLSWRDKVIVCSSDMPIKKTIELCIDTLANEWNRRRMH
ncbi:ribosylnicotinamide kinase, partial [Coemansia erecta]